MEIKEKKPLITDLILLLIPIFNKIKDPIQRLYGEISLTDCILSAFAMFNLKLPSLLSFDKEFHKKNKYTENLKNLFYIDKVPSDTYMRERLDEIHPKYFFDVFKKLHNFCKKKSIYDQYHFIDKMVLVAIDGSEFFSSKSVQCDNCLVKNHKNGQITWHHQALGCVIVHPNKKQVLPFAPEFICNEDGKNKNDCELASGKRLIERLKKENPNLKPIIIADSLFSNSPFITILEEKKYKFIIAAKPGNHSYLFSTLDYYKKEDQIIKKNFQKNGLECEINFINSIYLNGNEEDIINYIELIETNKKGEKKLFSWVTNLPINRNNCIAIAEGGRTKWHIENETFNTLKNQGYQFEHNFGHGKKNLCNIFATIMFLAFFVDQIQELICEVFNSSMQCYHARYAFWEKMRNVFKNFIIKDWDIFFKVFSSTELKLIDACLYLNSS